MSQIVYSMMVSLDGYVEGPNQELDWATIDEELHTFVNEREREFAAFIYGRRMYEMMSDFWSTADKDPSHPPYIVEYARIWQSIPKLVFSKSLQKVGDNARLISGDLPGAAAALKAQPGPDLGVAGPALAASFMQHGLVDAFELYIHPVVLGSGTPMFPQLEDKLNLQLMDTRSFSSGVTFARYQRVVEARRS